MTVNLQTEAANTSTDLDAMPRWDMSVVFPGLDSPQYGEGFERVVGNIAALQTFFDERGIRESPAPKSQAPLDEATIETLEDVLARVNAVWDEALTLNAFIHGFVSTDSRDARAQAEASRLRSHLVALRLLDVRLAAWLGSLDVEALLQASGVAREHAFFLRKTQVRAQHLLPPGEEELAAELTLGGGTAWARLHADLTSQLTVPFSRDEGQGMRDETNDDSTQRVPRLTNDELPLSQSSPPFIRHSSFVTRHSFHPSSPVPHPSALPMSALRALAFDADREVRRAAYQAELQAWEKAALPLAAAMNSIKHETNVLCARRGWEGPLDAALFDNNIDRQTLDAMMNAARESFPDFRRYLQAKARFVSNGQAERLPWHDLFAPVGHSARAWQWDAAESFVAEQFGGYSQKMKEFALRSYREKWIDAGPRAGKSDGAFCMRLRADESRILHNYKPAFGAVSTLAHELGHAYHNLCLAGRPFLQRRTPMTLAETASIFCETIIRQAALEGGDKAEQLLILEASLQGACQVVVDITSRFLFESRVLEQRRQRELSSDEFCELMLQAQRETYGDGLDAGAMHPYMWAVKGHYYGSTFYNFPYMFGLLFGLGLYAQYQKDPQPFRASYDDLLSSTGKDDAATLAARFGLDIRRGDFWTASFDLIRGDIARFEELAR